MSPRTIGKVLLTLCWLTGVAALVCAALLTIPVPSINIWSIAVSLSGYSSHITVFAISGFLLGIASGFYRMRGYLLYCGLAVNLIAAGVAVSPYLQATRLAEKEGLKLSWRQYFFGPPVNPGIKVSVEKNVEYEAIDGQHLQMDIYHPDIIVRAIDDRYPAVVVVHGGAWRRGSKGTLTRFNTWLAEQGFVVFDVDYRLVDEKTHFPDLTADIENAIQYIKDNAGRLSVDPQRIGLIGRSAGGQLALLAAYALNESAEQKLPESRIRPVKAVVSLYGPTDLKWGWENPCRPDIIKAQTVLEAYLNGTPATAPDAYRRASPVHHVTPASPPSLFLHGGADQMVHKRHVDMILPLLKEKNVPCQYLFLPWGRHGFDYNPDSWAGQIAEGKILKFLRKYLNENSPVTKKGPPGIE